MPEAACKTSLKLAIPAWLNSTVAEDLRAFLSENAKPLCFSFSAGERNVFRRRKSIPVSVWAERHRVLEMSSIPGRWKNLFTPYLVGIMDAAASLALKR